ncbi:hypothetical protein APA_838 [Pseudanabaena sp. lw0831]|nr:hypothetical protein APA_838 [Pseudanabaena sp. lw0831]
MWLCKAAPQKISSLLNRTTLMINIKFYRDTEGYFKADTEPQYQLLSQYFQSEVQGVAAVCEDLLVTIAEIEIGDLIQLEGVGNTCGLELTADRALLWNEFSEAELTLELSLAEFKQALEDCLSFLR